MHFYNYFIKKSLILALGTIFTLSAANQELPKEMQKIMNQPKYMHAIWGVYVKDLQTNKVILDLNGNKLFSPASTTKLLSVTALLQAFGDDYRFKTPVYATQKIQEGLLTGNLILVAQGDLIMGGREKNKDEIDYTKLDHIIANEVPGAILTKGDPLRGINDLAKQIYQLGLREIIGDVLIDDRLFEIIEKRGMSLSPIMINENLIDIVANPTIVGEKARLTWRPQIPEFAIENQLVTGRPKENMSIEITTDPVGNKIIVKGIVPADQRDIVHTVSIKNPKEFARAAFIQALKDAGIKINLRPKDSSKFQLPENYENLTQVALWTSPPLSEYAKLILKVSHNLGADLVPLLLASQKGQKTFDEGMLLLGKYAIDDVNMSEDTFVLVDAAGGNENRLTPKAVIQLLEFMSKKSPENFKKFYGALPIMGVDGSLEDFGKNSSSTGKIRAKTGTGVAHNLATGNFFLITQALAGYIEGENGHLFAYMIAVNNGELPTINDIFAIFEDESRLSDALYQYINQN